MKKIFGEFFNNGKGVTEEMFADKEKIFRETADRIKSEGVEFHKKIHDPGGEDPKIYHTSEHIRKVEQYGKKIAEILNLSPEQMALIGMAAAWHDTVIEYDKADPDNLLATIKRHRGARTGDAPFGAEGNEAKSAKLAAEAMRQANKDAGEEIFSEKQIESVVWAIEATYPGVNLGPDFQGAPFEEYIFSGSSILEAATKLNPSLEEVFGKLGGRGITRGALFFQPHLENPLEEGKKVPREVLAVALADLGGVGIISQEEFFKEGDSEMRELYANLSRPEVMRRLVQGEEPQDSVDRERAMEVFIGWLRSQTGFAAWQCLRFEKIIYLLNRQNGLNPEEEWSLRQLFGNFAGNILASCERVAELEKETDKIKRDCNDKEAFVFLARNMHYGI